MVSSRASLRIPSALTGSYELSASHEKATQGHTISYEQVGADVVSELLVNQPRATMELNK